MLVDLIQASVSQASRLVFPVPAQDRATTADLYLTFKI